MSISPPVVAPSPGPVRDVERRRWAALVVVCFAMLMNSLDQTIVNVALPTIQRDLHVAPANLAWVIDAYLITFGGALLLAGRLGDLIGRKKVFLVGVAVFTVASALCGAAGDQAVLIAARFAQGLGAAGSTSVIVAIIVAEFPRADERTRAMNSYVFVAVGGGAIGLLAGGALTQLLNWHWIFFINVPIGVATLFLGVRLIDENVGLGTGTGLDVVGSGLSTVGMMLATYAIVSSTDHRWDSSQTLGAGGVALVVLVLFVAWERRARNPIMPLRILRSSGLATSSLVRGLCVVGLYATFFIGAIFVQQVLRYGTVRTGLAYLPMSLTVLALSLGVTTRLVGRLGPKRTAIVGLGLCLAGLVLLGGAGAHTAYFPRLFAGLLLVGAGGGTLFTPLLTIAVSGVPARDAGLGSGLVNVAQQVAAALGVAVLGTVSAGRTHQLLSQGRPRVDALVGGYHLAFGVAVTSVAVALVVAVVVLRDHAPDGA